MGLRTALIGPIIEPPDQARDPADRADLVFIGAGIVGLATALRLVEQRPDLQVVILEKEATVASHQTGHNSGVVHAGLYYEPGSLKARLCREGKRELEDYCQEHGVPIERTGKLVVAVEMTELPRFASYQAGQPIQVRDQCPRGIYLNAPIPTVGQPKDFSPLGRRR